MSIQDVIEKCIVCPGICTYKCPIFKSTDYRAAAPVNIARAIYFQEYLDLGGLRESIGYCTLCGKCREACPINNPLPEAIKTLRKKLIESEELEFKPIEPAIYTSNYRSLRDTIRLGGEEYTVIDTSELYIHVSYGYIERISLETSYNEDPDIFQNNYSIELLRRLGLKISLDSYILHKPCKIGWENIDMFRDVFGKEEEILEICLGGGGLDLISPNLLKRIKSKLNTIDTTVITQCSRAAKRMREWGIKAYTPIELVIQYESTDK